MNQASEISKPEPNMNSRAWLVYLLLGVLATGAYFLLSGAAKDTLYNLVGASSVIAILVGVRSYRPKPALPWYVLASGLALFVTADVIYYNVYPNVLGMPAPFPSVADVFYASSYLVVAVGLALFIRRTGGRRDWGSLIDASIVATGVGLLSWIFLIEPYIADPTLPLLSRLVAIDYPLMGVVWVALAARFLFASHARPPALYLLIAAVLFHPIADAAYSYLVLKGAYQSGMPIDAGWILSYTFFGALALHPSMNELSQVTRVGETRVSALRLASLTAAGLVVPVAVVFDAAKHGEVDLVVIVGAIFLFSLVLIRMGQARRSAAREDHNISTVLAYRVCTGDI